MRPVRMRFAELGFELLNTPGISAHEKSLINDLLDDTFKWHLPVILAIIIIPVSVYILISELIGQDIRQESATFEKLQARHKGDEFLKLSRKCVLGANPFASLLIYVQLGAVILMLIPVFRSLRMTSRAIEEHIFTWAGTARNI